MFFLCQEAAFKEVEGQVLLSKSNQNPLGKTSLAKAQVLQGTTALVHISTRMIKMAISIRRGKLRG